MYHIFIFVKLRNAVYSAKWLDKTQSIYLSIYLSFQVWEPMNQNTSR